MSLRLTAVLLAVLVTGCADSTSHLRALQQDPVVRCAPAGVLAHRLDTNGTTHGIGFGGTSPTEVSLSYQVSGSRSAAVGAVASCASAAGWAVTSHQYPRQLFPTASGTKSFPGGWQASVLISYDRDGLLGVFLEASAG